MPSWVKNFITAAVIIAVLYVFNAMMSSTGFFGVGIDDYQARLLVFIAINIILATSLNLINGFTGQFSIGHAGFMAVGAYASAYFTVTYGRAIEASLSGFGETAASSVVLLIAIVIGALVAAIMGLIVGIPSLRLKGDYLAIVTLGFAEIIRIVILNIDAVGGATGYTVPGYANFLWVGVFAVITVLVIQNIVKSDMGRALVSIREDELAAEAMGVNTTRYKVTSFVIGSAFAGIAGVLFAHYNKFLSTNDFQFIKSFEIIIMIVIGGMGSMTGAILGAIIVTLGFAEIIRIVILNIDAVGGATGYTVPGYANFLWVGVFAVITVLVIQNIVKSDMGRALVSIREDELAAEAMGVNTTRYKVTSFVIGSAFAGIAGVLFAHYNKFLSTNDFQFIKSFEIIIMIVIGGMGSMTGAILGAIIVTLLPELLRQLPDIQIGASTFRFADLRLVIFALILVLTMILRPQGILGTMEVGQFFKRFRRADKPTGGLK